MFLPLALLSSLLYLASGDITTKILTHSSKSLKIKCDALPYRTVFHKTDCYIVVAVDQTGATKKCSDALRGARLAKSDTPDAVFDRFLAKRGDFMLDGDSSNQQKALCSYGPYGIRIVSDFPCAAGTPLTKEGTCTRREEETNPIKYRLMTPHLAEFTQTIELEQTVVIKGLFSTYNLRSMTITDFFEIELRANRDFHRTVPLSFKIDFKGNKVTLSHKHNTAWIGNETMSNPFKMNQPFDIRIKVHKDHFQILVDKEEFATYKHVMPFDTITHLWADGAGYISYFKLGELYTPVPRESASSAIFSQYCNQHVCGRSLIHPFHATRTPQCSAQCTSLRIAGELNDYHTRPGYGTVICIFLFRKNDYPLTMELRWFADDAPSRTIAIVGWYRDGKWQTGEYAHASPLPMRKGGERFDLEVKYTAACYEIYVNGVRAWTSRHRISAFDIEGVEIAGIANLDVQVK